MPRWAAPASRFGRMNRWIIGYETLRSLSAFGSTSNGILSVPVSWPSPKIGNGPARAARKRASRKLHLAQPGMAVPLTANPETSFFLRLERAAVVCFQWLEACSNNPYLRLEPQWLVALRRRSLRHSTQGGPFGSACARAQDRQDAKGSASDKCLAARASEYSVLPHPSVPLGAGRAGVFRGARCVPTQSIGMQNAQSRYRLSRHNAPGRERRASGCTVRSPDRKNRDSQYEN